jgi:hypothetical protein
MIVIAVLLISRIKPLIYINYVGAEILYLLTGI